MILVHPGQKTQVELARLHGQRDDFIISPNGEYYGIVRKLPLAPLQWLRAIQLTDLLTIDLERWLNRDVSQSLQFVPLLEVYRSSDKQLVVRQSLPAMLNRFGEALLLNDGQHILLSHTFELKRLGTFHRYASKTPEQHAHLASTMPGMMLYNYRTGTVTQHTQELRGGNFGWIDQDNILIYAPHAKPIDYWLDSWPGNHVNRFIYHVKNGSLLALPENANFVNVVPYDQEWLVLQQERLLAESRWQHSCSLVSRDGTILSSWHYQSWKNTPEPIPHQKQVMVTTIASALFSAWDNWQKRLPWLKYLPFGTRSTLSVLDLQSGQKLLNTDALETFATMVPSKNGKYLVVGARDKTEVHLAVYDLPIPPLAWWAIWLPRVAGVAPLVLVLLLWLRRKRRGMP
jgi:hypothetical protein